MSRNKFYDNTIFQLKGMFKEGTALNILDNMQAVFFVGWGRGKK